MSPFSLLLFLRKRRVRTKGRGALEGDGFRHELEDDYARECLGLERGGGGDGIGV